MRRLAAGASLLSLLALVACAPPPGPAGGGGAEAATGPTGVEGPPEADRLLVPPGYGSLRQDEITLTLRDGDVQVKVTPLEEWMLRLTAPDTHRRLSALARGHAEALEAGPGPDDPTLLLVSFHSDVDGAAFHPEDLYLENRGRRYAPRTIRPMTRGWGTQRLRSLQTESAVYAFDADVDLEADVVAAYRGVRNAEWSRILRRLLAEQARARARAGVGGP